MVKIVISPTSHSWLEDLAHALKVAPEGGTIVVNNLSQKELAENAKKRMNRTDLVIEVATSTETRTVRGWHECEFPHAKPSVFSTKSSGDLTFEFENGHVYVFPDMLLHYVFDHGYVPPVEFIYDVIDVELVSGERRQTRGGTTPVRIGYLSPTEKFTTGAIPANFMKKLEELMIKAASGNMSFRSAVKSRPFGELR